MPTRLRVLLPLALLLASAPLHAAGAPKDADLEARITAMGKVGSASSGQYSPDGSRIAFITTLSGSPQAWVMPAAGGYPRQVTSGSDPVSGLRWSPDGKLAYAVSPGGGYNAQLFLGSVDGTAVKRMNEGQHDTFAGDFAADGRYHFRSNARNPESTDTWIYDPAKGKAEIAIEMDGLGGIDDIRGPYALVNRLVTRGDSNLWLDDLRTDCRRRPQLQAHRTVRTRRRRARRLHPQRRQDPGPAGVERGRPQPARADRPGHRRRPRTRRAPGRTGERRRLLARRPPRGDDAQRLGLARRCHLSAARQLSKKRRAQPSRW